MIPTNDPKIVFISDHLRTDDLDPTLPSGGLPLHSSSGLGKLFDAMLKAAGVDRRKCLITSVFNLRPMENNIDNILVPKKAGAAGWPKIKQGKYCPPALLPEIKRLYGELEAFQPDLIIPLGSTALWSVTGATGLSNRHGFLHSYRGIPVIPTWHPDTVMKKYTNFMVAVNDIRRAVGYAKGEILEEKFEYVEEAGLEDIARLKAMIKPSDWISVDIETKPKYRSITCIGLGTKDFSICVNMWDPRKPNQSWWPDVESEVAAMHAIQDILLMPNTKVGQNFLYDCTWLRAVWGMEIHGPVIDTRLMHFALFPELPHSLAELASTYLTMPSWKALHAGFENDSAESSGE